MGLEETVTMPLRPNFQVTNGLKAGLSQIQRSKNPNIRFIVFDDTGYGEFS